MNQNSEWEIQSQHDVDNITKFSVLFGITGIIFQCGGSEFTIPD